MPAYNAAKYIQESIESVLSQKYVNWELIIIDDESTDNTASIAKDYKKKDSRIQYHWQKNGKQGNARNNGIGRAIGDYVAFLDADDIWLPEKLSHQIALCEATGADLVFGYSYVIEGKIKTTTRTGFGDGTYNTRAALLFLLQYGALVISTVLMTRSSIVKVHGFIEDEKVQYCEDWHFWLKVALSGHSFYTDKSTLSYYRIHPDSAAQTEMNANAKFFYALLDLTIHFREELLIVELRKRAIQLVYHNQFLDRNLAESIIKFMTANHYTFIPSGIHRMVFLISPRWFRKVFNYSLTA